MPVVRRRDEPDRRLDAVAGHSLSFVQHPKPVTGRRTHCGLNEADPELAIANMKALNELAAKGALTLRISHRFPWRRRPRRSR